MDIRWKKIIGILKQKIERLSGCLRGEKIPEEEAPSDGLYLCCIMAWEICEFARRLHQIPRKKYRLTIVDDGGEAAFVTLLKAGHDINRLTLVTDREEHFADIAEDIYEENGLVVEVTENEAGHGGITVEFKGAFRICMEDGTIYDKILFNLDGREWEAGALQKYLFGESSDELFLFGTGEVPEAYVGRVFVEKLANS